MRRVLLSKRQVGDEIGADRRTLDWYYVAPATEFVDVVFDGPPSHESGRFVEVEAPDGRSVKVGEWIDRGNGLWALRIPFAALDGEEA